MSLKHMILIAVPLAFALSASPAAAQGIPVFDTTTYLQALQTARQTLTMVQQGQQQIQQAQQTFNSLSKLTNVNQLATNLYNSQVRNILPSTNIDAATLLKGDPSQLGSLGTLASSIQSRYGMISTGSDADAAYAQALKTATAGSAVTAALGENTLSITQARMQGLDQLREALSTAKDPKDVMDLQARVEVEQAQLQNDMLKMQAIQMAQSGEGNMRISSALTASGRADSEFFRANRVRK